MKNLIEKTFTTWFKLPQKLRFILVGGYNTVFAYAIFCLFNLLFSEHLHYILVLAFSHVISVSHSFVNFRFFVFRSTGHFWHEYLRVNLVYTGQFVCNAALLYVLKDIIGINILLAQLICILTLVVAVYFLHKNFSFKQRHNKI